MDYMARHNIKNLKGILMYLDVPLVDFEIINGRVQYIREINRLEHKKHYPIEFLFTDAVEYGDINDFFKHSVVEDGSQDINLYLKALGLKYYDIDEIVKRKNGYNHLGRYWLKLDGIGAKCWKDIKEQDYPIYGEPERWWLK